MNIEVYSYEKKNEIHTFYLELQELSVWTHISFDKTEIENNSKTEQAVSLLKARIEDGVWSMLDLADAKIESFTYDETDSITEYADINDILIQMLIIMLQKR